MKENVAGGVPAQQVVHEGDGDARAGGRRRERQPGEALGEGGRRVGGHQAGRQEDVHQLEEARPVLRLGTLNMRHEKSDGSGRDRW